MIFTIKLRTRRSEDTTTVEGTIFLPGELAVYNDKGRPYIWDYTTIKRNDDPAEKVRELVEKVRLEIKEILKKKERDEKIEREFNGKEMKIRV